MMWGCTPVHICPRTPYHFRDRVKVLGCECSRLLIHEPANACLDMSWNNEWHALEPAVFRRVVLGEDVTTSLRGALQVWRYKQALDVSEELAELE